MVTTERQAFIDWMKAIGMFLIVTGHVVGSPHAMFNEVAQPIYTKQLGVAFFIFIMGWGLARERGDWMPVLFKRLFPIYFYGIICALILSGIFWFTKGDINESNYLPFFAGINVFFNYFPANPTTWYIGTYLHVLLVWALFLRGKSITPALFGCAFVFEIVFRAALTYINKDFMAYMMLPNWLSVFLMGMWLSDKQDKEFGAGTLAIALLWLMGLLTWAWVGGGLSVGNEFPFRSLPGMESGVSVMVQSIVISLVYIANTFLGFQLARRLFSSRLINFFSRNTILVFILHMPIIYAFSSYFYDVIGDHAYKRIMWVVFLFVALSLFSELCERIVNVKKVQLKVYSAVFGARA
ncbi:acyltransferase [Marinobacter salinisoli]|uniref:Acyltransferase n=1 Tax=Marinobacter salinisoli TaxID=2769486 RepID=A0ABX7MNP2_9GAMM|nr:acyltransferase [Marinobacter salinisoli]QSP93853.1 acyltransferase [Marinobacter salinisoli]